MAAAWGQGGGQPGMGGAPFGGNTNIPQWMQKLQPDQLLQLWKLMQIQQPAAAQAMAPMRGPSGQPALGMPQGLTNALGGGLGAQGGGMQNQLVQYLMQQAAQQPQAGQQPQPGQPGYFPQGGGGADMTAVLRALGFGG